MSEQAEEQEDDRATTQTDQGGEEPKPGEDGGPMGNPAQDEEALRKQQEDESQ